MPTRLTKRGYYTRLLQCALQRAVRAEPLLVLHDAALGLAEAAGAEDADVAAFTPAVAKGLIRTLCERNQAVRDRGAGDPRRATVKLYRLANPEPELDVPGPPRPRLASTDAARLADATAASTVARKAAQPADERAFYEAFAKDAARVLVTLERLMRELHDHHAKAYQALQGPQP